MASSSIVGDMHISWHGHYTVKIQTGETVLVLDPYSPETGLGAFRAKTDIVALSNPSDSAMSYIEGIQGTPMVIDSPGEYSLKNMSLHALRWRADNGGERSLQRWNIEDMVALHVGALNRDLADGELQELEKTDVDILFLPVGGGSGLTTKQALALVTTIEPKVVIPIHFKVKGAQEALDDVDVFAKEMGIDPKAREKKCIIKAKQLPQDDLLTILLSP